MRRHTAAVAGGGAAIAAAAAAAAAVAGAPDAAAGGGLLLPSPLLPPALSTPASISTVGTGYPYHAQHYPPVSMGILSKRALLRLIEL